MMSWFRRKNMTSIPIYPVADVDYLCGGTFITNHCWKCGRMVKGNGRIFRFNDAGYRLCDDCYNALICRVFSKDW